MDPLRTPVASGRNVGVMVQDDFGAKVAGQVFVCAKSVPVTEMLVLRNCSAKVPLLVTVIFVPVAVVPTLNVANLTLEVLFV